MTTRRCPQQCSGKTELSDTWHCGVNLGHLRLVSRGGSWFWAACGLIGCSTGSRIWRCLGARCVPARRCRFKGTLCINVAEPSTSHARKDNSAVSQTERALEEGQPVYDYAHLRWKADKKRDFAAVSSTRPRKCLSIDATRFSPSASPLPAFTVGMSCKPDQGCHRSSELTRLQPQQEGGQCNDQASQQAHGVGRNSRRQLPPAA
jgi:hypothetical protein